MISVAIVEDNNTIRSGLQLLIGGTEGYSCKGAYGDCESILKDILKIDPDVVLMDIDLPGMSGIEGIKEIKKILPECTIQVLTVYDENEMIFDALCAGASGYLVKNTPPVRLLDSIKEAYDGGAPMSSTIARKVVEFFQKRKNITKGALLEELTSRERELLIQLCEGYSYKAIANSLFISTETVKFHLRNIYKKLHVHSKSEAVAKALKEGLI
jgi:DNA-binding NarL/FixJ family response regulator